MRVLATGDHHWHLRTRYAECARIHDWMVDLADSERIDLFASGGDVYETASVPEERRDVAGWLTRMCERRPGIITRGNHDREFELWLLARLRTRHPLIIEERAAVHRLGGAAIAAIAWPDRAALASSAPAATPEQVDDVAREAFRAVLLQLRNELATFDGPRIGLGHFMANGARVSTGQPLLGMPLNLGLSDLALLEAPLILCSHIHLPQEWQFGDSRILYTGSPFRTDFGQLEEKSVTIAEFDGPRLVSVVRVPTPCARMIHLDDVWGWSESDAADRWLVGDGNPDEFPGAEIRFRYEVPSDKRDAAKAAASLMKRRLLEEYRAADVKVEEVVIPTTRARAPEIAAAITLADKCEALWTSRGEALPEGRRARLLGKVAQLEQESADAH